MVPDCACLWGPGPGLTGIGDVGWEAGWADMVVSGVWAPREFGSWDLQITAAQYIP